MNNTKRCMTGIAGALLICLIAISTASAYNADTACASLKEVIAGSNDLTALELVAEYADGSFSTIKLWTDSVIDPEEALCASLHQTIEEVGERNDLSRVILTLVADRQRVSYELSPEKSVFVALPEPVEFPDSSIVRVTTDTAATSRGNDLNRNYELIHNSWHASENPFSFWIKSETSPPTTMYVMSVSTWIKRQVGARWVDSCYAGNTQFSANNVSASGGPLTLQSGTYKQIDKFSGYHANYTWYEENRESATFPI
ncbi:hypothetical protein ASZ90_015542 [hydrocarbon metagenome]|uniref:Uncharacterized protein n=1 Tax=hydrocarbon metagenome TaxID=938273 RepID=A0A0W8F1Q5_9ZZZZ